MAITLRSVKGTALTIPELDGNFTDLDTRLDTATSDISGKLDSANGIATGTLSADDITADNLVNTIIRGKVQALGSVSGAVAIDMAAGDTITATITGNTTFSVTGIVSGSVNTIYLVLTNPGAGTITWPSGTTHNRGTSPIFSASGKTLIILDTVDNGATWMSVQSWRDYA